MRSDTIVRPTFLAVLCGMLAMAGDVAYAQTPVAYDSFMRYTAPAACAQAAYRVDWLYWTPPDYRDTTIARPLKLPSLEEAVATARQCVIRFTIAAVSERDLFGLGQAYVAAQLFVQADSAFQRLLLAQRSLPAAQRGWTLAQIVQVYLHARPVRLQEAGVYLAKLDSLDSAAAGEQFVGHALLSEQAIYMDSVVLAERETNAALAASQQLTGDRRHLFAQPTVNVIRDFAADLALRQGNPQQAAAAIQRTAQYKDLSPLLGTQVPNSMTYYRTRHGMPAPVIQATRWYGDTTAARPVRGKRSLIVAVSAGCHYCASGYAILRRLQAEYPDLDITFVTQTAGHGAGRVLTTDQEFEFIRQYFQDSLGFTIPIAIWQTTWRRRTGDGGLQQAGRNPNEMYSGELTGVLVDRQGIVRYRGRISQLTELRWRHLVGEIRNLTSSSTPPPPP